MRIMKHDVAASLLTWLCLIGFCLASAPAEAQRVTGGLMALYGFDEGAGSAVLDVSGVAPALNLAIENNALVTWLPGGGLSLSAGARLATSGPATKLIAGAQAGNELTVEAWIKPANVTQTGPARIVTISGGSGAGNLTLGQAPYPSPVDAFDFRLRTTATDLVGYPSLSSGAGSATTNLTHVVCTRDNTGNRRLYIDGALAASDVSSGDFSNWDATYRLLVGNENTDARPWAGVMRLVAVYDRDLTPSEVAQNRAAGPDLTPGGLHAAGDIIISALQGANAPAGQNPGEFVELFNTTAESIPLAGLALVSRVDTNADGVVDLDWQLAADLTGKVIAPHSFFLIAEAGVAAPGGLHDVLTTLDLATGEGGAAERAISLQLMLDGDHLDYVVYGRHNGQTPAGETPPGDLPFNGTSWPRAEVIRNTTGETGFQEGLLRRVSAADLYAGHDVAGYYTDESALGAGFPAGVWTSPHDDTFGAYQARNSLSPPVLPGASVSVTVSVSGSGTVALSPSGGVYPTGTVVQLTASAAAGWTFDHWSGDLAGSANPASVTAGSDLAITAHFTGAATGDDCEDFESGYTLNAELRNSADWFYADTANGPDVQAGIGVAGSVGLTNGAASFAWVANGFDWSDAQTAGVWMQMDFQTSATGVFDDDRLGWTISDTDDSSDWHFGVQMDPGGTGAGGNIECYWDGAAYGDDGGRASIVDLPAMTGNAWYRLRAGFTKLTAASCRIDVELRALDAGGNETGVVVAGSLDDTAGLAGNLAPNPGYFTAATAWPVFKNHSGSAGAADNACWGLIPATGPAVRFAAFGDFGQAGPNELAVANLVDSFQPDFCITTGDNSYGSNPIDLNVGQYYSDYIGAYQGAYGPGSATNRFFPSLGNHDYTDGAGLNAYLGYFTLPGAGIPGSGTSGNERYYDFVQGPVHFFVIDSNPAGLGSPASPGDGRSPGSPQGVWLQTRLAQSTSPWKIVTMHHPPFSSGNNHGSEVEMQWPYEAWGATAVLSGHDHLYERILRDDNADGVDLPYFITGAGGKSLYGFTTPVDGSAVRFSASYGSMIIDADDQSITFAFRSVNPADGVNGLVDSYTIGTAPTMYTLTASAVGGGSVSLSPQAGSYPPGTPVELTAVPGSGWAFDYWSGDLSGSANPATIVMDGNRQVFAHFTGGGTTEFCEDFASGYVAGSQLRAHPDWFYEAASTGPVVLATGGVAGSVGLGNGATGFAWVAHPFTWSDPSLTNVWMQMDFQTSATGVFDDDRLGWTTSDTDDSSDWNFGVQMDPGGAGAGGNIECYWDGSVQGDDQGRATIVDLPALAGSAWYRLRADFTKLTATSCRIDVVLTALDAAGNENGVVAAGTLANTALLSGAAGQAVPAARYFQAASAWPLFKNHSGSAGNCDNPCAGLTTGGATQYTLTVDVTGSGTVGLAPAGGTYPAGTTVTLTASPLAGHQFAGWSGALSGSTNPATLVMNGNYQVTAAFAPVGTLVAGDLIIAAVQSWNNPAGQNPGEFIELFNTTAQPIPLAGLQLTSRVDSDSDGVVEVDWQLAPNLSAAVIAPYGFFLIAESGVIGENGVRDLTADLDLATGEGGSAERAISLELAIGGTHLDYVLYGRHDGQSPAGALPPGDRAFNGTSWPRTEVIRNTTGDDNFQEGLLRRESAEALHAGFDVEGYYTDEAALGDGYPAGVWYSPHDDTFGAYVARNSTSLPVPPGGNQAPGAPTVVAPTDDASGVALNAELRVNVTDPDLDALEVTFHGRPVGTQVAENFTIIPLPDTQKYSEAYPATFLAQTQWVVDNIAARNIVYLAHEGDVVEHAATASEWAAADAALSLLEDPQTTGLPDGLPYGIAPGNHDQPTDLYNTHFGATRFAGRGYYGGSYLTDNDNNYALFSAGGMDFIVVNLEYNPSAGAIAWADALFQTFSERRGIVVSHYLLDVNANWSSAGSAIYETVKDNPNVFLMLCGHIHAESRRTDTYLGHTIHTLLADYQDLPNGGNGWLRIMEFRPSANQIVVQTYSPTLDQFGAATVTGYDTTSREFTLAYDMGGSQAPFTELGTVTDVASGADAVMAWPGLASGTGYEWYVEVSDGFAVTTSPLWSFTTDDLSGVGQGPVPMRLETAGNYPNPFNPSTRLKFALPATGRVEITLYDVQGRVVRTLADREYPVGHHEVVWDGLDDKGQTVPSGTYLYRIEAAGAAAAGKMTLMK